MANADGRSGSTGDASDIAPGLKGTVTGGSMVDGGQEVATELEVVVDLTMAGEEPLGMPRRLDRCICRSRRRVGWCETSAQLLRYRLCRCSTPGRIRRLAAP